MVKKTQQLVNTITWDKNYNYSCKKPVTFEIKKNVITQLFYFVFDSECTLHFVINFL